MAGRSQAAQLAWTLTSRRPMPSSKHQMHLPALVGDELVAPERTRVGDAPLTQTMQTASQARASDEPRPLAVWSPDWTASAALDTVHGHIPKQTRVKTASGGDAQPKARTDHQAKHSSSASSLQRAVTPPPYSRETMAPKDSAQSYGGIDVPNSQQLLALSNSSTSSEVTSSSAAPAASPERCLKRQRSPSIASDHDCEESPKKMKKRLRWSTITIHEFGVGLGGSSVPGKGGPSIGLSDKPEFTWSTKVGEMAECVEGVHRFSSEERVRLLQSAGVSEGMILRFSREANIINCSRRRTLVEDIAERKEARKQRQQYRIKSARPVLESSCSSSFLNRPHMIPVNYV